MESVLDLLIEMGFMFIFMLGLTFTLLLAKETGKLLESAKYNLYHGNTVMYEESTTK